MEKYDVAIVGGGVAGLSTAMHIDKLMDGTILLVDKGTIGDPTKTSPFTFMDVVERFDLSGAVLQRYKRFAYKSPTGVEASFEYEDPVFATLDYQKTCNILLNRTKERGTTEVNEKTMALNLETGSGSVSAPNLKLVLSNREVFCKVLVDASGSSFFTLQYLGIGKPPIFSHSYGRVLTGCKIEDPGEMCVFAGNRYGNGGGWLYPIDGNTARFGFAAVTESNIFPTGVVEANFEEARQSFYPYNKMLADAKTVRSEFGTIPIGPLKRLVNGPILIVGDAAGQATPWYNEGVRPALENGKICGEAIAKALRKGVREQEELEEYQRVWDQRNRKKYSRSTRFRFASYSRSQAQWDDSVRLQASLTPAEMIAKIRFDKWPRSRSNLLSRGWNYARNLFRATK